MGLRVIGAGLPRTGTTSLKAALEQLLGEPCYHMFEVFENNENNEHGAHWCAALEGDLDALALPLDGYAAAIDWPASLFWRELLAQNPDALVVLSHRDDAATWWASVDKTVWASMRWPDIRPWFDSFSQLMRAKAGLGEDWDVPDAAMACYDRIYDEVVAEVPPEKLVIWKASQGWEPLCAALDVPVPEMNFFHRNTTADFRERAGFDE